MQSSIASARWESIDSASDRDLGRLKEGALCEEFLPMDTKRKALADLAPIRLNKLAGENLELSTSLNVKIPTTSLLLLPLVLPLLPCFRKISGLSLTSGLKLTRLLVPLDILDFGKRSVSLEEILVPPREIEKWRKRSERSSDMWTRKKG